MGSGKSRLEVTGKAQLRSVTRFALRVGGQAADISVRHGLELGAALAAARGRFRRTQHSRRRHRTCMDDLATPELLSSLGFEEGAKRALERLYREGSDPARQDPHRYRQDRGGEADTRRGLRAALP